MTAVLINTMAVFLGGIIGILFGKKIQHTIMESVYTALAIVILFMGIKGALEMTDSIMVILSMTIGTWLGEWLQLDKKVAGFAEWLKGLTKSDDERFIRAFTIAFVTQCVGSLAIVGSIQAGLLGDYSLLYFKSILDFISSLIFASTLGIGAVVSCIGILIYQGSLVLFSSAISSFLTDSMILGISIVGSIILIAMALDMMKIKSISSVNMLPAMLISVLYCWVQNLFFI